MLRNFKIALAFVCIACTSFTAMFFQFVVAIYAVRGGFCSPLVAQLGMVFEVMLCFVLIGFGMPFVLKPASCQLRPSHAALVKLLFLFLSLDSIFQLVSDWVSVGPRVRLVTVEQVSAIFLPEVALFARLSLAALFLGLILIAGLEPAPNRKA